MVKLQDLKKSDFELVASWLSKPEINRWLTPQWRDHGATAKSLAVVVISQRNRLFVVSRDGEPCGIAALGQIDPSDRTATVWCALGDLSFRGQGIMSEALRLLAHRAFDEIGLRSLNVSIMESNVASLRLVEKAGFQRVGSIRFGVRSDGKHVNRVIYDLIPEDIGLDPQPEYLTAQSNS